jgi:transcriptional regulator with XRE-family HTH domain
MKTELSNTLELVQTSNNLTQQEFADKLGVSRVIYNSWVNGRSLPSLSSARKLVKKFGVDPLLFF